MNKYKRAYIAPKYEVVRFDSDMLTTEVPQSGCIMVTALEEATLTGKCISENQNPALHAGFGKDIDWIP